MLAALLCNLTVPAPSSRPKPEFDACLKSRFVKYKDETFDIEAKKPTKKLVKKVVKALGEIRLTEIEETEFKEVRAVLVGFGNVSDCMDKAAELYAYAQAVEILQRAIIREEEEAFLLLLMEL